MSTLQIVHSLARLQCTKCGAEANASCNCGEPYVPAAIRVKEYDKSNPGRSTRAAAADLGISNFTVSKARQSGVSHLTPKTVVGLDGKTYQAKREPAPKPVAAPKPTVEPKPAVEPKPCAEPDDGDFEKFKKQVAGLAARFERLTASQAREIVDLVDSMHDGVHDTIDEDDKRKRLTKEAKNPKKVLDDARESEQDCEMEGERDNAKQEARESGERWSDVKDDWEAEWLKDNWDDKREQEFLGWFKDGWKRDHGQEFPDSDFAQHRAAVGGGK